MSCPVCGFDPNPPKAEVSHIALLRKRVRDIFTVHALESWWLTQPVFVCKQLKEFGIFPKKILDVGCGDGRWWPAVKEVFPEAEYIGIDRLEDHIIINREKIPEVQWFLDDFMNSNFVNIDTVFLAGTLNPLLPEAEQDGLLKRIVEHSPLTIMCLFDLNQTGKLPDKWLTAYEKAKTILIPKIYSGPRQDLVVWVYERK